MTSRHAVGGLVIAVSLAASAVLASSIGGISAATAHHASTFVVLAGLTVALQALSLAGFASSISVAGVGMLATGFVLGVGPAVVAGILAALVHAAKKRPRWHKVLFNAGTFALAAGAGTAAFTAAAGHGLSSSSGVLGSALGGCVFVSVNIGLLTLAMAASEGLRPLGIWRQRLAWLTPHYLAFGPLALAVGVVEVELGPAGLVAAAVLPLVLAILVRVSLGLLRARGIGHGPARAG